METSGLDELTVDSISTGSVPGGRNSPGDRILPAGGTQAASTHVNGESISPDDGTAFNGITCPTANVVPGSNVVPGLNV